MADNSLGDRFMQKRRQAAAASQSKSASTQLTSLSSATASGPLNNNKSNRKKSFLEIQQEQEQQVKLVQQRDRQQQAQQVTSRQSNHGYLQLQPPTRSSSSQAGGGSSSSGNLNYNKYDSSQRGQQSSYHRSSSSNNRSLYNPNNNTSRNNNNRRGGGASRLSNLPIEQGVIHTLLDKFGFILCADRNMELFFHYSEYKSGHSDELQIGDEVEFRVNTTTTENNESSKLAALDVRMLKKGTIWWEREVVDGKVWEGSVELSCMREDGRRGGGGGGGKKGGSGSGGGDGIIRLKQQQDDGSDGVTDEQQQQQQVDVYYTPSDYKPSRKQPSRLERKDVIQFKLVTERRTGKQYARDITLVQSERERQRLEREAKLLENAPLERGKVVSIKDSYGFLRSVSRLEQVYFHFSHVESSDVGDDDDDDDGEKQGGNDNNRLPSLVEGQEVEFYVVNEQGGGGGRGNKKGGGGGGKSLSARKIKLLPKGTVKFEHELAQGVTGYVLECPVEAPSPGGSFFGGPSKKSGGGGSSNTASATVMGKIRLDTPIIDTEGNEVTDVELHPDMYPCGTFAISRASGEVGIWIRPGDTLLFDVIQIIADGTNRAVPTKHSQCLSSQSEEATPVDTRSNKALIRLVKPSLCGRTEGVIRSIRDNYGFIHSAERNVDVYFPLFEVLPNEIHSDLVKNNPDVYNNSDPVQMKSGRVHVEVGMEVSFDLSLQLLSNQGAGGRGGGRSRQNNFGAAQEKEGLRGRRVQILPKGTVRDKFVIASQVKGTVTKEDAKNPFIGMMELEEALTIQSANLRYPSTAKLLDAISAGKYGDEITFHDVLSEIDLKVIVSMVKSREDLEWLYVPVSGDNAEDPHNRKLRIVRKVQSIDAMESSEMTGEEDTAVADIIESVKGESDAGSAIVEASGDAAAAVDNAKTASTEESPEKPNRRKKEKLVKALRYDKHSFPDMSEGPLGVGDVVTCDIVLYRLSGAIVVENIAVVERKEKPAIEDGKSSTRKDLKGIVTEVIPSRQFGFITAVDEEGSKTGDHVFFPFKSVGSNDDAKKAVRSDVIRKGDEVKFDAGIGKNGKLCATNISILPRGTLKATAKIDKATTCTGYILMEPSHTTLANTPSHIVYKSNGPTTEGGAGRWGNVKEARSGGDKKSGSSVVEEGTILLLSDPSHVFSPKPSPKTTGAATQATAAENEGEAATSTDGSKQDDGGQKAPKEDATTSNTSACVHIRYKTSSIAYRTATGGVNIGAPKRGDLVAFGKTRGANLVKDLRVEKAGAATNVGGTLEDINMDADTAVFVSSSNNEQRYDIKLSEVISCHKSLLQDKEKVDGILYEGQMYGVCRTKDIHLASSFNRDRSGSSGGLKERPRLNLTVKKELKGMGGQIMAQSRMAKGPDGKNGFVKGWTTRLSVFVKEFVPSIESIEASGFESSTNVDMQVEEEMDAEVTTKVGTES